MKRDHVLLIVVLVAILVVVGGAGAVTGIVPIKRGHDSARPPCDQLPDRQTIARAIETHGDLVDRFETIGPGVRVEVATPCKDDPDRAIVRVTYGTDEEWKDIDAILTENGFGVPVEVIGV